VVLAAWVPGPLLGIEHRAVKDGLAVDMSVEPVAGGGEPKEAQDVRVRLRISDAATGAPLTGLFPAAWLDLPPEGKAEGARSCGEKISAFLGGSVLSPPEVDLNTYYVLALNQDATISVVDPIFGFGGSKLLTMVFLDSPGEDWALSADGERLFVSMPASGAVAVVETHGWKVVGKVSVPRPGRLALEPGGAHLWVATEGGVAAVDAASLAFSVHIPTGRGPHDLAIGKDRVFVTNRDEGTVSVIDARTLRKVGDVATGLRPVSVTWSDLAASAWVAHEGDGAIVAVDGEAKAAVRLAGKPGLAQIQFAPGGRLALAVNPAEDEVQVIDAAVRKIIQTGKMEDGPDQVAFTDEIAYVRHRGSATVLMIPLRELGREGAPVSAADFPGGQNPPGNLPLPTPAAGIVQAVGDAAVLVANPLDQAIYFYKEGMAAPMGHFNNYGRQPRAALVVDRSLRETAPGVYETVARLRNAGRHDLAVYLNAPRLMQCFPLPVAEDAVLAAKRRPELLIEPLSEPGDVGAGEEVSVRYRITSPDGGAPKTGLRVRWMAFLSPGTWQLREAAAEVSEGVYEVRFRAPQAGLYYVFLEVPSAGIGLQDTPPLTFFAERGETK
jgi:YVTN family beta-propeller protein